MLASREIGRNGGHFAVIGWNIASRLLVLASKAHLEGVAELGKHGSLDNLATAAYGRCIKIPLRPRAAIAGGAPGM